MSANRKYGLTLLVAMCFAGNALAKTLDTTLPPPWDFTTVVTNKYWPLPVGKSFAYMTETDDGCEYNKLTVTAATKWVEIDGVLYETRVIRDQAWESEECDIPTATFKEDTNDYYAMDVTTEDIWYFGEATWAADDESEDCTDEGAWEAGVDGAVPGIVMPGSPKSGDRYQQEFSEDNAEDWGAVMRLNARVSIGAGDFEGCLVTKEWTPLAPGENEHKYYCPQAGNPGPGLVFIEELKGKTVYVEFLGEDLLLNAPGELLAFPALDDVGSCSIP